MTAVEIAETYINGNIRIAREELKAARKVKVLDVVDALGVSYGTDAALTIVRGLLS